MMTEMEIRYTKWFEYDKCNPNDYDYKEMKQYALTHQIELVNEDEDDLDSLELESDDRLMIHGYKPPELVREFALLKIPLIHIQWGKRDRSQMWINQSMVVDMEKKSNNETIFMMAYKGIELKRVIAPISINKIKLISKI